MKVCCRGGRCKLSLSWPDIWHKQVYKSLQLAKRCPDAVCAPFCLAVNKALGLMCAKRAVLYFRQPFSTPEEMRQAIVLVRAGYEMLSC